MSGLPVHLLPHVALIERKNDQPTAGGGFVVSWETVASDVPCRFQQGRPQEILRGDIEEADVIGHVYFSVGTDVQRDDRVTVDGIQADVYGIRQPSVRDTYVKAILREVQEGITG